MTTFLSPCEFMGGSDSRAQISCRLFRILMVLCVNMSVIRVLHTPELTGKTVLTKYFDTMKTGIDFNQ